jgi:hypothetical protein
MTKKEYKSYGYNNYGSSYKPNTYSPLPSRRGCVYNDDWYDQSPQNNSVDDLDWEIEYGKFKKNRRKERKGRTYMDNGFGLEIIPRESLIANINDSRSKVHYNQSTKFTPKNDQNYYDNLIDKIVKDDLTKEELLVVKEQYLDMEIDNDRMFYQYLLGNIID